MAYPPLPHPRHPPALGTCHAAVEQYRRERFFADLHSAYERLAADRAAWQDELAERAELDGTLADGLGEM